MSFNPIFNPILCMSVIKTENFRTSPPRSAKLCPDIIFLTYISSPPSTCSLLSRRRAARRHLARHRRTSPQHAVPCRRKLRPGTRRAANCGTPGRVPRRDTPRCRRQRRRRQWRSVQGGGGDAAVAFRLDGGGTTAWRAVAPPGGRCLAMLDNRRIE